MDEKKTEQLIKATKDLIAAARKFYEFRNLILTRARSSGYRILENGESIRGPWTQAFQELKESANRAEKEIPCD